MIARPPQPASPTTPEPPLRAGANLLQGRNSLGFWIQGPTGGNAFQHPYTVVGGGRGVRVSKGLLLGDIAVEPVIGTVPISGDENTAQPTLKIDPAKVNKIGESWVCVEVTPTSAGKLAKSEEESSKVEVVQRDFPLVAIGETGRFPLALLVFRNGVAQLFQITMFHLRYETTLAEGQRRRHFFL